MFESNFVAVEDVLVRPEVVETSFSCDLNKCKGACCTMESEYGAPLLQEELGEIEKHLDIIKQYLPEKHLLELEEKGFYNIKDDELLVHSVDNKACVFVYFEEDIAKCGIEKAFNDGKIDFKKPISCHLFPIRISKFGGDVLRYEKFFECKPALEKGKKLNVNIVDFCKESLTRLYGKKWYSKLKEITG